MTDTEVMQMLIKYTRERALENKTFTGAFILKDGEIVTQEVTSIEPDQNPLAHAEMKALSSAIKSQGPNLKGCYLYTTQQPCPMCASAMIWSGIEKVVYGVRSSTQWKTSAKGHKFLTDEGVQCIGPLMEKECKEIDEYLIANGI